MGKIFLVLGLAIVVLGLIGGLVYALLFMEEETPPTVPAESQQVQQQQTPQQPDINVIKKGNTAADLQENLDHATTANHDTVGWIRIDGTEINNSVLQSHDNTYYLRRNERKQDSNYGCYYVDFECSVGATRNEMSPNTIIYGHSDLTDNPDGPRFSQLFKFTDSAFAESHPIIEFSTLEDFMYWEIFSVMYTDLEFNFIDPTPNSGIKKFAQTAMDKSLYDYGVTVENDDKVLVLSTCTVKFGEDDRNHRFVIMAKLLPEDAQIPKKANITIKNAE